MVLLLVAVILAAASCAGAQTSGPVLPGNLPRNVQDMVNSVVDFILAQMPQGTLGQKLHDEDMSFPLDAGHVALKHGTLKYSHITRQGDVKLDIRPNAPIKAEVDLHFNNLQVNFRNYSINAVGFVTLNYGHVISSLEENAVRVYITFDRSICHQKLNKVDFTEFGGFDVKLVSTCASCSTISQTVFGNIRRIFNKTIKESVDQKIVEDLKYLSQGFHKQCTHKILYSEHPEINHIFQL